MSLGLSKIPNDWRFAKAVLILKSGLSVRQKIQRPGSIPPLILKTMDSIIYDAIIKHPEDSLLEARWHDFTSVRSFLTNLLPFLDKLTPRLGRRELAEVSHVGL